MRKEEVGKKKEKIGMRKEDNVLVMLRDF